MLTGPLFMLQIYDRVLGSRSLAVIECKSPYITNPMEAGINQLLRYANRRTPENDEGAEKLFHYNQMMVTDQPNRCCC